MATRDLRRAFDAVTYKPGWRIVYRDVPHQGPYVSILADVPNSYQPGETVPLRIHSPIPPMRNREELFGWLIWRLVMVETHEVLEWLKVGGTPYYDPHTSLDAVS